MTIDLNKLSLKELKDLQSQVVRAIASFEDRKKKEALAELEEKARAMGFSLAELTGASVGRKRSPSTAKYRNPANASDTWPEIIEIEKVSDGHVSVLTLAS